MIPSLRWGKGCALSSASIVKRALRDAGFEVYRTDGDVVHVAERVRENLIMDSGIRIDAGALSVSFYARAEESRFPGETEDALYERAAALGTAALERGYSERRRFITHMTDPGDRERMLDRWYQVQLEKAVADIDGIIVEVTFVFALDKSARH